MTPRACASLSRRASRSSRSRTLTSPPPLQGHDRRSPRDHALAEPALHLG
ncbi:uncharacterized protein CCOS01_01023 [Colletotrichum costaricense]|uniref:Uncharacterized protein n=1 Tax=Colletotrichum costaricense TaxID=1209916 RepID=A0AAI9ZA71_9PEZI|nr:uncharacterized protein CCOS01_01023 [Colletotrichum costaricense]KAK1539709.1 hypothetical protein CCOS01_01023 [Colletotrichum costaricense]